MVTMKLPGKVLRRSLCGLLVGYAGLALAGGDSSISYMRDNKSSENTRPSDSTIRYVQEPARFDGPSSFVMENKMERRAYSLLDAARSAIGPQSAYPACADSLSPTQREEIAKLAENTDSTLNARLTHQVLLQQTTLEQVRKCVNTAARAAAANKTAKR